MDTLTGGKFATGRSVVMVASVSTTPSVSATVNSPEDATELDSEGEGVDDDVQEVVVVCALCFCWCSMFLKIDIQPVTGSKRKAAEELPNPKGKVARKRSSGASAIVSVADAINNLANSFSEPMSAAIVPPATSEVPASFERTPVRRGRAIKAVEAAHESLGMDLAVRTIRLFSKRIDAVDTFNAISWPELREAWLQAELYDE